MEVLWNELQYIIVLVIISALAFGARMLFRWLKQSKNKFLNTIGDLAYQEIENSMNGSDGSEKMKAAIQVVKSEMEKRKLPIKLSDERIQEIIQNAWERSNTNKNTPHS